MKKNLTLLLMGSSLFLFSQMEKKEIRTPELIPKCIKNKLGYVDQTGKMVITPEYHIAMFFSEDCNLLNSPNEKAKAFGTADYATVEKNKIVYRIDKKGKRVYQVKKTDYGKCIGTFEAPKFKAFPLNGAFGLVSKNKINTAVREDFDIYPQYQMVYVMDSNDRDNPMIIAVQNDKFGVIDKKNNIIIPFVYNNIKTNMSWKIAYLFEVSMNGKDYYYIDENNHAY